MRGYESLFEVGGLSDDQAEFLRLQAAAKERKLTKEEETRYVQLAVKLRSQGAGATVDQGVSSSLGIDTSHSIDPDKPKDGGPGNFGKKAEGSTEAAQSLGVDAGRETKNVLNGIVDFIGELPLWVKIGGGIIVAGAAVTYGAPVALTLARLKGRRR